ncbi:MAG: YifB family Mg chelatase-like AAA ATPase [Lachnospiraceae bacterium]|nr:YifB family Mg chelatase-like AAA ATPase [Lachnospiraceae bacterium]
MFCSVLSGGIHGIKSFPVHVETDISNGMPCFDIVGYVGSEVKEAKDRVRAALRNAGFTLPVARITVNLSPGDVKKSGTCFDLPVAISILVCMEVISPDALGDVFIAGELSLSGAVCPTKGILPMMLMARERGVRKCIIPADNSGEGSVVEDISVYGVSSLTEAVEYLTGRKELTPIESHLRRDLLSEHRYEHDFAQIKGQKMARRGAEIAVAGLHNFIMMGPPGAGKTLIAKCLPSIMPPLSEEECLDVSAIYSVRGALTQGEPLITTRPFVAAHSSSTDISLVGGGTVPRPGAVSLAHKGVLFLDEIPEFSRKALEALRQPLEDGIVHITRNRDICTFPADFMLVAAMNPCPCGNYPDMNKCTCNEAVRAKYLSKISGPFLDRMDICIVAEKVSPFDIQARTASESSKAIRERIMNAHRIQKKRFKGLGICFNSQMTNREIEHFCTLGPEQSSLMKSLAAKFEMSARTYYRVLKVARTIADLSGQNSISSEALMEAVRLKVSFA